MDVRLKSEDVSKKRHSVTRSLRDRSEVAEEEEENEEEAIT
jgi:hypothetical protein